MAIKIYGIQAQKITNGQTYTAKITSIEGRQVVELIEC